MPTLTETLEALSEDVRGIVTRLDAILTTGKPGDEVGAVGAIAIDLDTKIVFGPKAASGADPWGDGEAFAQGPDGLSAKAIVIAAGALPSGASDEDFADWLANAQVASVTPLVVAAEDAADTATTAAATATAAAATATDAKDDAESAAATATSAASTASAAATTAVDAKDDAEAAKVAAEAARDAASAIAGGDFQPLDADLTAIAGLAATVGLIKKTGTGTAAVVAIGAGAGSSILDRDAADARYPRTVGGVAPDESGDVPLPSMVSSVAGLSGAVSTAALLSALGLLAAEAQQGFTLAELTGSIQALSTGVADSFADGAGISSLGSFRRVQGGLTNTTALTTPTMTGDTTSGWTAGSNDNSFRPAWRAFDKSSATEYRPDSGLTGSNTKTIELTPPAPIRVREYSIQALSTSGNYAPTAWTLEGSNDGTSWTTLDSRTGITGWTAGLVRTYAIAVPDFYLRLRWSFRASQSSVVLEVGEIALTGDGPTAVSATAQSVTFTAGEEPSEGVLTVRARRLGGSLAVNTDLIGWISRDGGATWASVTLTAGATVGGITTYKGAADLTGQPSGTAMRWMIAAATAAVEVTGVALQWT